MPRLMTASTVLLAAILIPAHATSEEQSPADAAMAALDLFMESFNSKDEATWAASMHYPHVRFASNTVRVWQSEEDCVREMDFGAFAQRFNWSHSAWDSREVIQESDKKVHVQVTFSRYDSDGNKTASHNSLYIVTNQDGVWKTQGRSSFAP